ncbi:hypothetical protein EV426DRAFT_711225 [Tirmania nivea]|nr:hypothetical protein EV426DRAFT_711225 [Tirmania nivea]
MTKDDVNFPTLLYSPRSHLAPTTPLNPVFFTSCIVSDMGLIAVDILETFRNPSRGRGADWDQGSALEE